MSKPVNNPVLLPGESVFDLGFAGLFIIQADDRTRFGADAVLLAHFCGAQAGDRIADLGAGSGIIALLLAGRQPDCRIDAVELRPAVADRAVRNVAMNGLENRIHVHTCDLRSEPERLVAASYDRVVCNPPYHRVGEGKISADGDVAAARHELYCTLRDAVRVAADLLADHGRFCIVYPARRQRELLSLLREYALAPSRIRGVSHSVGRKASLCLTEAVKNGACSCLRLPDLVQYDERGRLTGEMRRIYHMEESGSFGFSESPG